MEQNQVPIICDTNIWYYIASGQIPESSLADKYLVGTFLTGYELCTSFHLVKNYDHIKQAVSAYVKAPIITTTPVDHIRAISSSTHDADEWDILSDVLTAIFNLEKLPDPHGIKKLLENYEEDLIRKNNHLINSANSVREQLQRVGRGQHKRLMNDKAAKDYHLELSKEVITNYMGGLVIDWQAFDLFLVAFDEWSRQLSIHPSMVIKPNDWVDLLNLVYVQPGSLYWTKDERRTKKFVIQRGYAHYLVN
ncbi:hypothetical protein M0L20_29510 [Spirosoma sp. RP8]|uniref:PIN domain-containing protein n=1 Tax=Spirosoma liriopis TaxID=2937440 RepID=A0ABT0HWX8_9BACT|nr:hypothetical protein [Spirosoma liriopis]MCK8496040.1 hypothetical protein [Spirosoma liriopis]